MVAGDVADITPGKVAPAPCDEEEAYVTPLTWTVLKGEETSGVLSTSPNTPLLLRGGVDVDDSEEEDEEEDEDEEEGE